MAKTGRRSTTKFILRKELIILVLVLVAMLITTICLSIPYGNEKNLEELNAAITEYNSTSGTSYTLLGEDTVIRKTEMKKVGDHIAESKGTEADPKYTYILYGSLSDSTILQYLSKIDSEAQQREVKVVYLVSSEKVDTQEDKDDADFLAELEKDEKVFNADVLEGIEEVDLLETPALYVYKNGELVFNSVPVIEDGSYNWELVINVAFSK